MTQSSFQESARRHLWMHFAELAKYQSREIPTISKGDGPYVWDDKGKKYIDGLSALYCVNVGHGRTEIADAVHKQMEELAFFPVWNYVTPKAVELAEKLAELAPGETGSIFFTSGGSESVESAWKLTRQYHRLRGNPGKSKMIARAGAYHGTTMGALSITGIPALREPFEPLVPGVLHGPQVNSYRAELPEPEYSLECANAIGSLIESEGADQIAAVIVEPVQNAGGCLVPDRKYYQRLREICDQFDVLLISDETVCSWGRLGTWFGSEYFGYEPDIITTAKGITSAYVPMGAVIARENVMSPFRQPGAMFEHGLTFGGHPAGAAAALTNIEIIEREDLNGKAEDQGRKLMTALNELRRIPIVGDVRGAGLFMAIELVADQQSKESISKDILDRWTDEVPQMLYDRGLVCRALYRGSPLIQLAPTLVVSDQDVADIAAIIGEVLTLKAKEVV